MLCTILTPVHNAEETIADTIESVLAQTYPNIEYIIIDRKSTDHTLDIIDRYQARFKAKYGKSIQIYSQEDQNMYDALNIGARYATGEVVGQINADDRYTYNAVETMLALYKREGFDAAWGSIVLELKNGKKIVKQAKIEKIWTSSGWCHPACFSKRSVLLTHPYILDNIYADFDYITSLHMEGYKLSVTNEIISCFSFGKGGISSKKGYKEMKKRVNATYSVYKTHGMSRLYYPYRILYELIKNLFC